MATVINGTSRYDLKDYMANQVAPKYFDDIPNMNELNVGLFGYITEILSDTTNDTYFSVASMYKEIFPHLAELPESIYNHALIFQLSNIFSTPASAYFTMLIREQDVIDKGTVSGDYSRFTIDGNLVINIDSLPFMVDYDIQITSKNTTTGWVHSAQYMMTTPNDLSDLNNPYIRTGIYLHSNGTRYISMQVKVRQVSKKTINDTILSNDVINATSMDYQFTDSLAAFNIYYRAPGASVYTTLKKRLYGSGDSTEGAYCFYKLKKDNTLQISFSNSDTSFQPEYNSDIIVEIYTTKGADGNFESYSGDSISIAAKHDRYSSNRGIMLAGNITTDSTGGTDAKTLEQLQDETVKAYSTVKSFSTTNDLNLYFDDVRDSASKKSQILFMRKRDDVFERLYSAFILFRDTDNNVIPTNTLDVRVKADDVDYSMTQTSRNVIKAGKLYRYEGNNSDPYAETITGLSYTDNLDPYETSTDFIYVNPFLTVISTDPLGVSFYMNTIDDTIPLSAVTTNTNSFYQFIVDAISIKRDALLGDDKYTFSVNMAPIATLPKEPFTLIESDTLVLPTDRTFHNDTDSHDYIDNKNLKVVVELLDSNGDRACYVDLDFVKFDETYYYFEGSLTTNDYVSNTGAIQITDGFLDGDTFQPNLTDPILLPGTDCAMRVYVLYQYPDGTVTRETEFNRFPELVDFTLTNQYQTTPDVQLGNFILPVQEIRSYVQYSVREPSGKYGFRLEAVPLVKANYLKLPGCREAFVKNFTQIYQYLEDALESLTNNYAMDVKFFNTYGPSLHYFIAGTGSDNSEHIDRVNVSLKFRVKFNIVSNVEAEVEEVKNYIKTLVEDNKLSLASSPSFYYSNIGTECTNKFSTVEYMVFVGLNEYGSEVQALESDVNEYNIINGVIETSTTIPEYINVDYKISGESCEMQIEIEVI